MFFLQSGECGCVLPPNYQHFKYVNFTPGSFFGVLDIFGSCSKLKDCDINSWLEDWYSHSKDLVRQFTVSTQTTCELLTLTIHDLWEMKSMFFDDYRRLMSNSHKQLAFILRKKL